MPKKPRSTRGPATTGAEAVPALRIIGGRYRGSVLRYSGDPRTRPMKDRVREAVFNLLADRVVGMEAIDLFAGTGALGLEALSRGAARVTFVERHVPTARVIRENIDALGVASQAEIARGDTFFWYQHDFVPGATPLLVFCSPPYDLYVERQEDMLAMLNHFVRVCPDGSALVVECDQRFDLALLPRAEKWRVRVYSPAVIAVTDLPLPT